MEAEAYDDEGGESCAVTWDPSRPPPSVIERYYEQFYAVGVKGKEGNDFYIHLHTNRLCVIGLAPSHPIVQGQLAIKEVVFDRKKKKQQDRAPGEKKVIVNVFPDSVLCDIVCDNGLVFPVYAVLPGELMDKNAGLLTNPQLITSKTSTDGYIGIVAPKAADLRKETASFLSPADYERWRAEPRPEAPSVTPSTPAQSADPQ
eukprot:Opistho-2@16898